MHIHSSTPLCSYPVCCTFLRLLVLTMITCICLCMLLLRANCVQGEISDAVLAPVSVEYDAIPEGPALAHQVYTNQY
jgi:hypothetical protein